MRNIVTYETQHGSAKRLAKIIADKLDALCINVDTPFQAEDETTYDNLILVFGFRGPYTAQLTKLFVEKMKGKLTATFNSFFMKGQLRVDTLTPEEQALLGKFSELTGMQIVDMGEFSEDDANKIADDIVKLLSELPVPEDPNAGKTRWICTVCGYVHTGDEPPEKCPVCGQPASVFKKM